jgi:pimeloyl-ACP methyl ester carboxylesterase
MPYPDINGTKLFYECTGSGDPPLVFVHGFACGHDDWRYQVEHFGRDNLAVACDLRGHGRSGSEPDYYTIEILSDDLEHLLKNLNVPPAVLVGHSMGCRVVLQAYSVVPELVASLILLDGSRLAVGNRRNAEQKARQMMRNTGYTAWAHRAFANMFLSGVAASLQASIIKRAMALPEKVGIPLFASLCGWDAEKMDSTLAQISVPLLLIQSTTVNANLERVSLQPGASTPWIELVRNYVPGAQIEIVGDTGHFSMLEAPEVVNQRIASFLASS